MTAISGLTALTKPAYTDLLALVDVSDTTQAPTGTTKKGTLQYILGVFQPAAAFDGVTDDSTAIQAAIDAASAAGGGVVQLPAGTAIIGTALVPKNKVTVRGMGMGITVLKQAGANRLFELVYAGAGNELPYFAIEDVTLRGRHDTIQTEGTDAEKIMLVDGVDVFRLIRVECIYARYFALGAGYCLNVTVDGCIVRECVRDAINLTACRRTVVVNNHVMHVGDDSIAIHNTAADGNPPAEGHVVANNYVEDANGIKLLGAVKAAITGNTLTRVRGFGVYFADESAEGNNDMLAVAITGNTITDVINTSVFGGGSLRVGIRVVSSVTSFQVPVVGGGTPDINYPEDYHYLSNAATQNAGGSGILIADNVIFGFTLPDAANYSDWGYGEAFLETGFFDPAMTTYRWGTASQGIRLGGALLSVSVHGNHIEGVADCVALESGTTHMGTLVVTSNLCRRYSGAGVMLDSGATLHGRVRVTANEFDGDPYFESANRTAGPTGAWSAAAQAPLAVYAVKHKGCIVQGNSFRNLNQVSHQDANSLVIIRDNSYYMEPNSASTLNSSSSSNKGIRRHDDLGVGGTLFWEDSTPTNATYGQVLGVSVLTQAAMPTASVIYGVAGQFVINIGTTESVDPITGEKYTILGWKRLTTSNAHVLNTDWRELRGPTGNATTQTVAFNATTMAVNFASGTEVTFGTLTANVTAMNAPSNIPSNSEVRFYRTQDATGGRTFTWHSKFTGAWPTGSGTANQVSVEVGICNGTNITFQSSSGWFTPT